MQRVQRSDMTFLWADTQTTSYFTMATMVIVIIATMETTNLFPGFINLAVAGFHHFTYQGSVTWALSVFIKSLLNICPCCTQ